MEPGIQWQNASALVPTWAEELFDFSNQNPFLAQAIKAYFEVYQFTKKEFFGAIESANRRAHPDASAETLARLNQELIRHLILEYRAITQTEEPYPPLLQSASLQEICDALTSFTPERMAYFEDLQKTNISQNPEAIRFLIGNHATIAGLMDKGVSFFTIRDQVEQGILTDDNLLKALLTRMESMSPTDDPETFFHKAIEFYIAMDICEMPFNERGFWLKSEDQVAKLMDYLVCEKHEFGSALSISNFPTRFRTDNDFRMAIMVLALSYIEDPATKQRFPLLSDDKFKVMMSFIGLETLNDQNARCKTRELLITRSNILGQQCEAAAVLRAHPALKFEKLARNTYFNLLDNLMLCKTQADVFNKASHWIPQLEPTTSGQVISALYQLVTLQDRGIPVVSSEVVKGLLVCLQTAGYDASLIEAARVKAFPAEATIFQLQSSESAGVVRDREPSTDTDPSSGTDSRPASPSCQ